MKKIVKIQKASFSLTRYKCVKRNVKSKTIIIVKLFLQIVNLCWVCNFLTTSESETKFCLLQIVSEGWSRQNPKTFFCFRKTVYELQFTLHQDPNFVEKKVFKLSKI